MQFDLERFTESYAEAERQAALSVDPRIMQCAASPVFQDNGFPHRGISWGNLAHYLDSQQENRGLYYLSLLDGLTDAEALLFEAALGALSRARRGAGGPAPLGVSAALHGLFVSRYLRTYLPDARSVFEIGPGSGWLGFYLPKMDIEYRSAEVNANFFVAQEYLLRELAGEWPVCNYVDLQDSTGRIHHFPWWKFYQLFSDEAPLPKVDCVVMNHLICELPDWSLRYILSLAKRMLDPARGRIVLQGFGDERLRTRLELMQYLREYGFRIARIDADDCVVIAVERGRGETEGGLGLLERIGNFASRNVPRRFHYRVFYALLRVAGVRRRALAYSEKRTLDPEAVLRKFQIGASNLNKSLFVFSGIRH